MAEKRVWYRSEKVWFDEFGLTNSISMCPGPNPKAEIIGERGIVEGEKRGVEVFIRFTAVD